MFLKPVPFIAIEKTQSISFWPTLPVFIVSKISKIFFITQSASYLIPYVENKSVLYFKITLTLGTLFVLPPVFPLY